MIHAQVPLRVPCYDFVPVTELSLDPAKAGALATPSFLDVTGGEYKTWERIHRGVLIRDY